MVLPGDRLPNMMLLLSPLVVNVPAGSVNATILVPTYVNVPPPVSVIVSPTTKPVNWAPAAKVPTTVPVESLTVAGAETTTPDTLT